MIPIVSAPNQPADFSEILDAIDSELFSLSLTWNSDRVQSIIATLHQTAGYSPPSPEAARLALSSTQLEELLGTLKEPIVGRVSDPGSYPLLLRITDLHAPLPSNLEKKLIAGGATDRIINDAKNLRANASIRESEILASGFLNEDKKIIDVQIRLETLTNSIVEHYEDLEKPAKTIWREVLDELTKKKESVDPNRIYRQDPYLLLGAICIFLMNVELIGG